MWNSVILNFSNISQKLFTQKPSYCLFHQRNTTIRTAWNEKNTPNKYPQRTFLLWKFYISFRSQRNICRQGINCLVTAIFMWIQGNVKTKGLKTNCSRCAIQLAYSVSSVTVWVNTCIYVNMIKAVRKCSVYRVNECACVPWYHFISFCFCWQTNFFVW